METVITLEQAKLNLKVDFSDDDAIITANIAAAQGHVQNETGLVLSTTDLTETAANLASSIELEAWPIQQIKEIRYTLPDGTIAVLPGTAWRANLNRRPVRIYPTAFNWGLADVWCCEPRHHHRERPALPVEVDITAGYDDVAKVPPAVIQAMHLLIAHFYANRKAAEVGVRAAAVEIPFGVSVLLDKHGLDHV